MLEKYGVETRIFRTAYDKDLFKNAGRIKTNKVYLLEEIFLEDKI